MSTPVTTSRTTRTKPLPRAIAVRAEPEDDERSRVGADVDDLGGRGSLEEGVTHGGDEQDDEEGARAWPHRPVVEADEESAHDRGDQVPPTGDLPGRQTEVAPQRDEEPYADQGDEDDRAIDARGQVDGHERAQRRTRESRPGHGQRCAQTRHLDAPVGDRRRGRAEDGGELVGAQGQGRLIRGDGEQERGQLEESTAAAHGIDPARGRGDQAEQHDDVPLRRHARARQSRTMPSTSPSRPTTASGVTSISTA